MPAAGLSHILSSIKNAEGSFPGVPDEMANTIRIFRPDPTSLSSLREKGRAHIQKYLSSMLFFLAPRFNHDMAFQTMVVSILTSKSTLSSIMRRSNLLGASPKRRTSSKNLTNTLKAGFGVYYRRKNDSTSCPMVDAVFLPIVMAVVDAYDPTLE
ncbi:hypothetical protein H0H81_004059 [Sphagnurus paluster]|uniref:Uncharacterized protein n=1 Tax=Sphagnurus paluster TaxID=117069 RepID=A0A9P7FWD2_9AGAR|nr:hypothetical protein H0H81_004059 [Sphagnurus paluster]